jgi:hypothetical protein
MSASPTGFITTPGTPHPWLHGRRLQISGSANAKTDAALIAYAHEVVRGLVKEVMRAGGGIVVGLGKEPRPEGAAADAPSLLFDWTALEAAADCIASGVSTWPRKLGLPIVVATSQKAESEIPENRRGLYSTLLKTGLLQVESIMPGSRAATFVGQRQAEFGDALFILGGGTGVEHSASLYLQRRRPVVLSICHSEQAAMTGRAERVVSRRRLAAIRRVSFVLLSLSQTLKAQRSQRLPHATAQRRTGTSQPFA